jgi:putative oxidoreductase
MIKILKIESGKNFKIRIAMTHSISLGARLKMAYQYLVVAGGLLKSPILLLCRLYWGWLFFQSGLQKLHGIADFAQFLEKLNFSLPYVQAYLAGLIELIGGACLMMGFASRLVAIPLAIVMLVAYINVHVEGFWALFNNPALFVAEAPFNFLLTTLIVLAFGPGRFSVDYFLEKWFFQTA